MEAVLSLTLWMSLSLLSDGACRAIMSCAKLLVETSVRATMPMVFLMVVKFTGLMFLGVVWDKEVRG